MSESTGDITGVCVLKYCMLLDCVVGGYVPNVCPMRFAKGCPNVKDGHTAVWGKSQVASAGLRYPRFVA